MRIIFLFFLSINLIIYVWQSDNFNSQKATQAQSSRMPENVAQLVLLKEASSEELSSLKSTAKPSKPTKSKTKPKRTRIKANKKANLLCYTLGPFEKEKQASPIAVKLTQMGADAYGREDNRQVPAGYWVYLPRFKSWKKARAQVIKLEEQGMRDLFIMGRGKMKNAVSLGLFRSDKSAERRVAKLKSMGVSPKVETQFSLKEEHWVDIAVESKKKKVIKSIEVIAASLTKLQLKKRSCE